MRKSHDSRRCSRVARLAILLITAILAVSIVACDGSESYELSISSSSGGTVTSPGEAVFTYDAGIVVELVATPHDGYEFDAWIGDTDDIADANCASTNVTMNGNYAITAIFREQGEEGGGGGVNPIQP